MLSFGFCFRKAVFGLLPGCLLFAGAMYGQDAGTDPGAGQNQISEQDYELKAVPVLTGSTAYFTRVNAGQVQDAPSVSPLLLIPMGDRWLIEAKGSFSDTFAKNAQNNFDGTVSYGMAYAQIDYITKYVTVVAGRFTTPFGVYSERYGPNWIRALQVTPMISSLSSGSALGGMLRGGIPAGTEKVNFTYAAYFSSDNTNHIVATDRSTGGRIGFFLPAQRVEFGASFQQVLQADRAHSAGAYFAWQPYRVPLSVRSEFARQSGTRGSGYWVEGVYRLSQVPSLKRLELAARAQQFYAAPNLSASTIKKLAALGKDTNQADVGINYYLGSDVRASAGYSRQFVLGRNANLWTIGMTYRFVVSAWPGGGAM